MNPHLLCHIYQKVGDERRMVAEDGNFFQQGLFKKQLERIRSSKKGSARNARTGYV